MPKYLLVSFALLALLQGRENPFFPAEGIKDMPVTASETERFEPLKRAAITLPDSARVLKKVTVSYQNLDGSIGEREILLDNAVDWHVPIFITQSYSATENAEKSAPAAAAPRDAFKKVASFEEVSFYQSDRSLKVVTSDPLLRHFILVDPHRVVLDFKRDADFRSKFQAITGGKPFKSVRLGNHKGYYRAVIELDGRYECSVDKSDGSQLIRCF